MTVNEKIYPSIDELINREKEGEATCPFCQVTYRHNGLLNIHIVKVHKQIKVIWGD